MPLVAGLQWEFVLGFAVQIGVYVALTARATGRFEQANKSLESQHTKLQADMRDGFNGVHSRLDTLNGKVFDHEGRIAGVEARQE